MKRSPPQVRQSAIGLPPLSELLQKGNNLDFNEATAVQKAAIPPETTPSVINAQFSSVSPRDAASDRDEIDLKKNSNHITQRGKGKHKYRPKARKDGKSHAMGTPGTASRSNDLNTQLLESLNELREEMAEQRRENQGIKRQLQQLRRESLGNHSIEGGARFLHNESVSEIGCSDIDSNIGRAKRDRRRFESHSLGNHSRTQVPNGLRVLLDDGISPTFDAWLHLMKANLRTYQHCFQDQVSILDHVFAQTTGTAMAHLIERMKSDHPQAFTHEEEMFDWLEGFFKDPNERETARIEYGRCRMSVNETFNQFYSRFSTLASRARIEQSEQLRDMFRKLHPDLHQLSINFMATNPDYPTALKRFHYLDNELRINREYRSRRQTKFTSGLSSSSPSFLHQIPSSPHVKKENSSPRVSTLPPENPVRKCYNCRKPGHQSRECSEPPKSHLPTSQIQQIQDINSHDNETFPGEGNDELSLIEESENEEP